MAVSLPIEQAELLKKFSQAISAQDIQLYYQIVLNGRKELPYAADEQAAFDMTLIRLLAFKPMQLTDVVPISTAALGSQTNTLTPIDFNEATLAKTQVTKSVDSTKVIDEVITSDLNESNIDENVAMQSEQAFLPQQQSEESLTEQMQSIEQQAFEQGHNHLVDHIEPEIVPPEVSLIETVIPKSVTSEIAMPSAAIPQKEPHTVTPVDAGLATRNMLRSRKKQLETKAKKPSDAISRHSTEPKQSVSNNATENITPAAEPAKSITPEPEAPYQADTIDPAKVRLANQVDKWSHMIDSMALNGRIRQIAIHATISDRSTDEHLILKLDQATKHLNTENAHQQLQTTISEFLARNITVTIEIVEQTVADPYQIQAHINDKRYDYAKALLLEDDIVLALQNEFQATIDEQTIAAR
jgi:DNA polymerase-3 subunit gamma/tau